MANNYKRLQIHAAIAGLSWRMRNVNNALLVNGMDIPVWKPQLDHKVWARSLSRTHTHTAYMLDTPNVRNLK